MDSRRFNGLRINLDTLNSQELDNLEAYVNARLDHCIGELATIKAFREPPDNVVEFPGPEPEDYGNAS